MTAEQLKASVLQMAIEGKLVPQLDDEPAVDIEAVEPEEVPFAIPGKWKWVRIEDVFTLQAGKFIQASEIKENGAFPCYGGNGLRGYVEKSNRKGRFPLIGRQGALCGNINMADGEFYATEHAVVVDCHEHGDPDCVGYFLRAMNLNQYATATAQPGLAVKNINKLFFPLPSLAEQCRIAARLNEILPLIEEYGKAHSALKNAEEALPDQLRASLLQEAIQGKLVPQLDDEPAVDMAGEEPDEVPFAIPEKWKWVTLKDVGNIVSGATPKTSNSQFWEPGTIPWITPADLGKNNSKTISHGQRFISQKGLDSCSAVLMPKDSIVYSSRAPIGHIAIAENELCTNQGCKSVVPNTQIVLPEYVYYTLISLTPDIQRRASGTTFLEISGKKMGETLFPLPPLAEQRRIVARLEELLPHVDAIAGLR